MKKLRESEKIALSLLHKVLSPKIQLIDLGRNDNEYDCLVYKNQNEVAVEITEACNKDLKALDKILMDCNALARPLFIKRNWIVSLKNPYRKTKKLLENIGFYLAEFELADISKFNTKQYYFHDLIKEIRSKFGELDGHSFPVSANMEPKIYINRTSCATWVEPESVNTIVEAEAWKLDNRSKLNKAVAIQRMLFILINADCFTAHVAMREGKPPIYLPKLPYEISDVLVATEIPYKEKTKRFRIWGTNLLSWINFGLINVDNEFIESFTNSLIVSERR